MIENPRPITDIVLIEISYLLSPLKQVNSAESVISLMRDLGWELPSENLFVNGFPSLVLEIEKLIQNIYKIGDANTSDNYIKLLKTVKTSIGSTVNIITKADGLLKDIRSELNAFPDYINDSGIISSRFPERLFDYLVFLYFQNQQPKLFSILNFLGVVENKEIADPHAWEPKPSYSLKKVYWDRIPNLFTDPLSLADAVYDWHPQKEFKSDLFLSRLEVILKGFLLPGGLYKQNPSITAALSSPSDDTQELRIPIHQAGLWPATFVEAGLSIAPVPKSDNNLPKGFSLVPYFAGTTNPKFDLTDIWEFDLSGVAGIEKGIGLIIRPPKEIDVISDLFSANASKLVNYSVNGKLRMKEGAQQELFLFGTQDSSYLKIKGAQISLSATKTAQSQDIVAELNIETLSFQLTSGEGDGFVQKILPRDPIRLQNSLTIGLSRNKGFYFNGSSTLEINLPFHIDLGPVVVEGLTISIKPENKKITIAFGADIKFVLGPIVATVQNMGILVDLAFPAEPTGNLGPLNADLGFKPPTGVGLSIDAGVVKGGGFLTVTDGTYLGAVSLTVKDEITLQGIGCIITRMPDGSPGYSFKLLAREDFEKTPIQLGMGFSIIGLGALVALECSINTEFLKAAVYADRLKTILFPEDLVKNAPAVIANLNEAFPPCKHSYVFGVLAKINWGSGLPIFQADLAIFMEFNNNVRVVLAGVATLQLPSPDSAVIRIQLQILGVLDINAHTLALDAKLVDSHLASFVIEGEAALRLNWGTRRLAFSCGGFHPAYVPPPDFPVLQRMALVVSRGNPTISYLAYFAVTENTYQFGAKMQFYWEKKVPIPFVNKVTLSGSAGYDAIIYFNPFKFKTDIHANFDLKADGTSLMAVDLDLALEGPNNYHIYGKCKVSVYKFSLTLEVDHEFGKKVQDKPITINSKTLLENEINKNPANWKFQNIRGYAQGIVLKDPNGCAISKVDPLCDRVTFEQKSIPLGVPISRVGTAEVEKEATYEITEVWIGETGCEFELVYGLFSPGTFKKRHDIDKLSRDELVAADRQQLNEPSCEEHPAGFNFVYDDIEIDADALEESSGEYEIHYGIRPADSKSRSADKIIIPIMLDKTIDHDYIMRTMKRRYSHQPLEPVKI